MNRFFVMLAALGFMGAVFAAGGRIDNSLAQTDPAKAGATPSAKAMDGQTDPVMLSFADMNWVDLPERPGMRYAILSGNPKTGAYTQMRKVPAGTDNGLHRHSSELKNVIISGNWYTGANMASAKDFGPGSIVVMPGDWTHVSGCRAGSDCVFYQEGKGKFDFKAAEAANKPMR